MNRTFQWVSLAVVTLLLAGILAVLVDISRNGLHIEHTGRVELVGMYDRIELTMPDAVSLTMPGTVHLVATGADGGAIPISLSADGSMILPLKFDYWTGKIEWGNPKEDH